MKAVDTLSKIFKITHDDAQDSFYAAAGGTIAALAKGLNPAWSIAIGVACGAGYCALRYKHHRTANPA